MKEDHSSGQALEGILHSYFETGTEGNLWAFQDNRFIYKVSISWDVYVNQTVYDSNNPERRGKIQNKVEILLNGEWLPFPDPMTKDPDYYVSSLFKGEIRDREADKRLMKKYGFKIKDSVDKIKEKYGKCNLLFELGPIIFVPGGGMIFCGCTTLTEPPRPYGAGIDSLIRASVKWDDGIIEEERLSRTLLSDGWEREGMHILEDGDHLTIYHPDDKKEVWNGVIKLKWYNPFTEHTSGRWIHADQIGMERDVWAEYFFERYPARLVPAKKSTKKA